MRCVFLCIVLRAATVAQEVELESSYELESGRRLGHQSGSSYDYAPLGETGQIIATVFEPDGWYQSTFQVHVVTKDSGHDGATARSVGVAALAGIVAVLLMG